jgi:Tol biopolymer transport system component
MRRRSPIRAIASALPLLLGASLLLPAAPAGATFPGVNGKIAFASNQDGDMEIFTIEPNGTGLAQLTTNTGIDDRQPAWSPDGSRIAFNSNQGGDNEIWVMGADGSNPTQLTSNAADDSGATWSPDGAQIAFASDREGDYEVYVMNSDGTGQTKLTDNSFFDCCPSWSPDGTQIAYQPAPNGPPDYDIYVMDADGTDQTPLAAEHSYPTYEVGPKWGPDGSAILFAKDFGNGAGWGEVFRMYADGSNQTNLTNTCCIWESDGTYSPDGTKIAFISNEVDPSFDLYLMDADGTDRTVLYAATGQQSDIDWQRSVTLSLVPATDANVTGTVHTVTADLNSDLSGVDILFTVTGPNATDGTVATNATGTASFTYTGLATGTDAIDACADLNDNGSCDGLDLSAPSATKIWYDDYASVTAGRIDVKKRPTYTVGGSFRESQPDADPSIPAVGSLTVTYKPGARGSKTCTFTADSDSTLDFTTVGGQLTMVLTNLDNSCHAGTNDATVEIVKPGGSFPSGGFLVDDTDHAYDADTGGSPLVLAKGTVVVVNGTTAPNP